MPFNEIYRQQAALLIQILPHVAAEECFALKGGTAINLFHRDMPRLSVDIDLTYLPIASRADSLRAIDAAMARIRKRIKGAFPKAQITGTLTEGAATKLIVRNDRVQIKIEVTPVLRGWVFPPERRSVSEAVEQAFGFAEMSLVSFADLYAGKMVAALDRQHPRDLFDIRELLANEGITDELRSAFLVYVMSHNRPMSELLAPNRKDITLEYERDFAGMTEAAIPLDQLLAAREELIEAIVGAMPRPHREFLISFERGDADWSVLGIPHIADLPAIRWRQQNLDSLTPQARAELVRRLEDVLL